MPISSSPGFASTDRGASLFYFAAALPAVGFVLFVAARTASRGQYLLTAPHQFDILKSGLGY